MCKYSLTFLCANLTVSAVCSLYSFCIFFLSKYKVFNINMAAEMKILLPALGFHHVGVFDKGCEKRETSL